MIVKMPRKGRLHLSKYFEVSKRVKNIPPSFKVSLPIINYYKQPLQNLKDLEERLCNMGLPEQWTGIPTNERFKATIFTTMLDSSLLMLKIDESLDASLKYDGYEAQLPDNNKTHINSAYDLHSFMSLIKQSNICKGNRLKEFDKTMVNNKTPITLRMGKPGLHTQ